MKEASSKKQSDNWHWWDFYLVRYLLPTLVGACIIVWLIAKGRFSLLCLAKMIDQSSQPNISFAEAGILFLCAGFIFCYIASFPVLVFHAFRKFFNGSQHKVSLIFYSLSALGIIIMAYMPLVSKEIASFVAIIITSIFSLLQIVLIFSRSNKQFSYLKILSIKRSKETTDIVDSYKHLREHGNAALIVICELFLAALCHPILFNDDNSSISLENFRQLGLLIGIWSLPAACIYFFGHHLEYQFVNDNNTPPEKSKIGGIFSKIRNLFSCIKQIFHNPKK